MVMDGVCHEQRLVVHVSWRAQNQRLTSELEAATLRIRQQQQSAEQSAALDASRIAELERARGELEESATVRAHVLLTSYAMPVTGYHSMGFGLVELKCGYVAVSPLGVGLQVLQRSVVNLTHDLEFSRHALDSALGDVRRRLQSSAKVPGLHPVGDAGFASYVETGTLVTALTENRTGTCLLY